MPHLTGLLVNNFTDLTINDLIADLQHKAEKAEKHTASKQTSLGSWRRH